jgi:hypothetical protein
MATQVQNGKAFEFALAKVYYDELKARGLLVTLVEDAAYDTAKGYFENFPKDVQKRYIASAEATLDTMLKIEPGLTAQKDDRDILSIRLASDVEGQAGDVRDVIFTRTKSHWEMGFSAKNNNDSQKHSRISGSNDFGQKWFGYNCSDEYWRLVRPVFEFVKEYKDKGLSWDDMGDLKESKVYIPLLDAFRKEILRINNESPNIPQKLISYVIGAHPFYQVIKLDSKNLVVVKAFNINGGLNKTVNKQKSRYGVPKLELPTRIVELEYAKKPDDQMQDTLNMILDGGWEISFRIHSADNPIVLSCKFDVKLLGNPPILFSQYLFQ